MVSMIDRHLRYLMLYSTFEKIKNEAAHNSSVQIDSGKNQATLWFNIGSILEIEMQLTFFKSHDLAENPLASSDTSMLKP